MESLEMLANNLANASTSGYKSDREFYGLYRAPEATDQEMLPVIEREWTDFRQGTVTPTGKPLDLALSGKGFFKVAGTSGPLYTRNGNFRLSTDGAIRTAEGYAVVNRDGGLLEVDPAITIDVAADGTVSQGGQQVGRLDIMGFQEASQLRKQGESYFLWTGDPRGAQPAEGVDVLQGRLESANVSPAETSVRLIHVMRQFEMLQRAVVLGGEMNRRAIEEVAKST